MYAAGQFSPLIEKLRELTKSHPEAFELWNMLGVALEGSQYLRRDNRFQKQPAGPESRRAPKFCLKLKQSRGQETLKILLELLEADSQKGPPLTAQECFFINTMRCKRRKLLFAGLWT